jgi:citrate lyase subunit beta/citryl-CoA lyase
MPASNRRALEKARGLAADGLIFDLEDAVTAKERARSTVAAAIRGGRLRRARAGARNPLGPCRPRGRRDAADREVREIAAASPRLAALVLGTSDLTKELTARHTSDRLPLVTSLGLAMLAARAYRLAILDGVHPDLADAAGFAAVCRQGREFGFDGKTLIHPMQIKAANASFAPGAEDAPRHRRACRGRGERRGRRLDRRSARRKPGCRAGAPAPGVGRGDRADCGGGRIGPRFR